MRPALCSTIALALAMPAAAEITLETPRFRAVINDDGTWGSLVDEATGRQCLEAGVKLPIAVVRMEGKQHDASSATLTGGTLALTFQGVDTKLTYALERDDDWVAFRLAGVSGTRPESLTLLMLPIGITENLGRRLNAGWDEETAVCLMAAGRTVDCRIPGGKQVTLAALTQDAPGPKLEGAAAALIVAPTPEFKAIARKLSHTFDLLTNEDAGGTPVKDTDLVRGSYWFLSFGEQDVDEVIGYCEAAGIRQVMMGSGAWCTSPGHYLFNETRYPNGIDGLKAVVEKLHEHDILVGMHTFVSKVSKRDPYVTPVPDLRLWQDREAVLAGDIAADATEVVTSSDLRDWPGSPVAKQTRWEGGVVKHQEVIIGDEIIQYESTGPEGEWNTFLGCKRGAWGTTAAAHSAGDAGRHYGVDGCINGYIIDQETDLMDEVAEANARVFNECDFDMVYFDGGEDVDRRRFNHYVSNFQAQAVRRYSKRPVIHMGTIMTHLLWHSFARSSTVDTYLNTLNGAIISGASVENWPTVKGHIDKSVRYMLSVRADMMPGELGWFGIWPKGTNTDGLQFDEVEYLMCKSLGYDVPISLQTSIGSMQAHPLTPEILRIVKQYEWFRLETNVPQDLAEELQEEGADFAMVSIGGETGWHRVKEVPLVGGTHDVRSFVGEFSGEIGQGAVATLWHYFRDAEVLLDIPPDELLAVDFLGDSDIEVAAENGKSLVPVDVTRATLIWLDHTPDQLRAVLENAEVRARPVEMIFLHATDFTELVGEMATGVDAGIEEPEAFGDVVLCKARPNRMEPDDWYAEYTIDIPHGGRWALWARVRYPSGADDSLGLVLPGDKVALDYTQTLGNCGQNEKQWHWTGRGSGSTSIPPATPIVLNLEEGPFTFRVYAREGGGTVAINPRLDLLCLSDDPTVVPTDDMARERLAE